MNLGRVAMGADYCLALDAEKCIFQRCQPKQGFVWVESRHRGVAQSGSASGLGPEGRRFESYRPDHTENKQFAGLVGSD